MSRTAGRPDIAGRRVLVLGLGATGRAVAEVLSTRAASVFASDARDVGDVEPLRAKGVEVETGSHERASELLDSFDVVVPSPGVSPHRGFLAEVLSRGATVVSEFDIAAALTRAEIVAVTGTNGKTTTCVLAEGIARAAGRKVCLCGNTETPFVQAVAEHPEADLFVVEASSFGLYFCRTLHPRVAVITNFFPDHLDWHVSIEDYRTAKGRIAARLGAGDLFLYPQEQAELEGMAPAASDRFAFGSVASGSDGAWVEGGELVVRLGGREVRAGGAGRLSERGSHFAADAAAAAASVVFLGAGAEAVERGLEGFEFARHRLEPIGEINGVRVVDDSVATNAQATLAALRSFDRIVLIAGGRNKGLDLAPLASEAGRMKVLVTIGEAADELSRVFVDTGVITKNVGSMHEAVSVALESATPGDVVLLSPACASHDMFDNYAHRGRVFREACAVLGVL